MHTKNNCTFSKKNQIWWFSWGCNYVEYKNNHSIHTVYNQGKMNIHMYSPAVFSPLFKISVKARLECFVDF